MTGRALSVRIRGLWLSARRANELRPQTIEFVILLGLQVSHTCCVSPMPLMSACDFCEPPPDCWFWYSALFAAGAFQGHVRSTSQSRLRAGAHDERSLRLHRCRSGMKATPPPLQRGSGRDASSRCGVHHQAPNRCLYACGRTHNDAPVRLLSPEYHCDVDNARSGAKQYLCQRVISRRYRRSREKLSITPTFSKDVLKMCGARLNSRAPMIAC
jgi:hypothetical protein